MIKNIAVITGASSGMGREFALSVEKQGKFDEIWVIARSEDKLAELCGELKSPVKVIAMDLTAADAGARYRALLDEDKPRVGILINCSGYGKFGAAVDISADDNLGMIDLNCRALTELTILSLPYMTDGSKIVNIASVAAFQPVPYMSVYAASKAYVLSFSRALGREVAKRGIRVLAVCPYWTKTAFFERAEDKNADEQAVKKFNAMYSPAFVVKKTWKTLEKTNRDFVITGFKARMQTAFVRLLPKKIVMDIWLKQQKLQDNK